jgi:hypothetical protein
MHTLLVLRRRLGGRVALRAAAQAEVVQQRATVVHLLFACAARRWRVGQRDGLGAIAAASADRWQRADLGAWGRGYGAPSGRARWRTTLLRIRSGVVHHRRCCVVFRPTQNKKHLLPRDGVFVRVPSRVLVSVSSLCRVC